MSRIRQFTHLFDGPRRITATLRVDLDRASALWRKGSHSFLRCEWEGSPKERQPSAELFAEYRTWMHDVISDLVAQTRKRMLFAFEPPAAPRTIEFWIYEPFLPPRLAKTLTKPFSEPISEALGLAGGWGG